MCEVNGTERLPAQQNSIAEQWATYPQNVVSLFEGEDLDIYKDFFALNALRLFSNDKFQVAFWTARNQPDQAVNGGSRQVVKQRFIIKHDVNNQDSFDARLQEHIDPGEDHFILLVQNDTWSALSNTEETMRKILSTYCVHPGYLDFLSSFGAKRDELHEDVFGGYFSRFWTGDTVNSGFELFYNLRYVEKTGRDPNPWSLRRMGIYQRHNTTTKSSVWILIQPTDAAKRLVAAFGSSKNLVHLAMHVSLMSSITGNWRSYLKELDNEIREKGKAARFFKSDNFDQNQTNFPLAFSEVQRLQYLRQSLQDTVLILVTNLEILAGIQASLRGLCDRKVEPSEEEKRSLEESLQLCASQITMHRKWAEHSLSRAQSISDLFHALLGYRNDASVGQNSANLAAMATASGKDSQTMLALTNAAKRDSGIMRLIAVITMVYLPGTFMATLFSTVFVNLASATTPDLATARREGGIYAGVTILLMIVTLGGGYYWDRRERGRQARQQQPAGP